jgi:hypothetical protein
MHSQPSRSSTAVFDFEGVSPQQDGFALPCGFAQQERGSELQHELGGEASFRLEVVLTGLEWAELGHPQAFEGAKAPIAVETTSMQQTSERTLQRQGINASYSRCAVRVNWFAPGSGFPLTPLCSPWQASAPIEPWVQ